MRRIPVVPVALSLACAAVLAAGSLSVASAAEATKSLRAEMAVAPSAAFAVENLAGAMHVVPGSGTAVVVTATVHAASEETAAMVKVEQVTDEKGVPALRVIYPLDRYGTIRYAPKGQDHGSNWMGWGGDGTTLKYGGQKVRVSTSSGEPLFVDVEVQVPAKFGKGTMRNHVGAIAGKGLVGDLAFDTASGDIALDKMSGTVKADTGSGDIKVTDSEGSLKCDTGSGDVVVEHFTGDAFDGDVGSGDITLRSGAIRSIKVDTGSGDVAVKDVDAEEFTSDCGSGDLVFETTGTRLTRVTTDSGSGDVTLRLGPAASFEARVDQGSGDLINHYLDAQPIAKGREVIGYRRGDGRTQIHVETGSGDLVIEPGGASASR